MSLGHNAIMSSKAFNSGFQYDGPRFDLFRLSKSKETVDICPNTLRTYHRLGLPFYRKGKAVFISRTDLTDFIQSGLKQATVASETSVEKKGGAHAKS